MKLAPLSASFAAVLAASAWAAPVQLRVLETSDVHMNLLAYDYYQDKPVADFGLERAASLIAAARAEAPNSLLIDNGDLLQGSPMGDLVAKVKPLKAGDTHPAYKALNALGYDAGNLGNHEFNYGLPFLRQSLKGAAFPYVNANVLDAGTGQPLFTPYVLLKREVKDAEGQTHALTVGVIGFAPPQILQWDKNNLQGKVTVRDILETARDYVPKMRAAGADVVIAVPHSGFEKGELPRFAENAVSGLAEVPGIDAILFGHAHAEFPSQAFAGYPKVDVKAGTINGVPAAMPGRWGDHLGVIDLTLEQADGKWRVVDKRASLRPIFDKQAKKPLVEADPRIKALVGAEHQATLDYVRGEVAATRRPIYSYFAQVADDPSVAIVAEAQRWYMQRALQGTEYEKLPILSAAAPFKAGGRQGWNYYTDIPAGKLAIRNLADLYIYPNTIKAVKITGADVREWLEMSAGQFRRIDPKGPAAQELINPDFRSYNFDSLYGVSYQIDVTQAARYDGDGKLVAPDSRRIVNLTFNGKPIDPAQRFIVVTNNYRASGGGNFPGISADKIVVDAPDENRAALASYLASKKVIDLGQSRNWRVLPVAGVGLRFTTGAGALRYLPQQKQFKLVQENGDGSATLELAE
ncbi:bifunctional 2',3'-cyclic-nucleotide 2'-phosphodiesterase/3'-nucleotidase [Chromobacterium violaceum]|uniref:bifunctional 2',3'-cyclic-nucleotide 2'-phosphodiesterase/3'-nucleotidase n=1 Tax=Chromobacterium violaceum TaxID=536 RepID=UPI0009D92FDA|nr:bifunctional 2',3'-cyclic-nucleotide 2'-phosphodiesterase/3'-nucleotidase [Chromobacterium violaceum]OQS45117.1 2',3'-cyclic-nucleotide 2'-phosphodiesterase [Chromobacterium violaceum]OQS46445.1 2',3'-cyclic-nucleotide 2'-phosphodiesterase [Chromobacterium violaceum]QRO31942.1 bifunctional 2',3'-cyclic-nucleotide 2'-phosphodiesterase/3'-nucleotidase [Chromobacterium violaceum]QRQ18258.1 bifunctional 2',3'-cyclic-nucleotide 2'-phosphodiesterase/3'-nucleotidase [Chromobacterium violaceum]